MKMRSAQILAGSLLAAIGPAAASGDDATTVREHVAIVSKIAASFAALAGGDENAVSLVESLREGVAVNLSYAGPTPEALPRVVPIQPPTGRMDWSDVRMALMLTRDALMSVGVLRPSGEQLHAALLGGEVAVPGERIVAFKGVLRMRADGRNWGAIASERFQRAAITRIE
jgi:hypothetical protein